MICLLAGGIVAGVLVPIFVIAAIVGIWYYRKPIKLWYYSRRANNDTITFTNDANGGRINVNRPPHSDDHY